MEAALSQSRLAVEVGVNAHALLQAAAATLATTAAYCQYLVQMLPDADDACVLNRPNIATVFVDTWFATSLATLSDADLANLWRLADYLQLRPGHADAVLRVAAQREVRSNVASPMMAAALRAAGGGTDRLLWRSELKRVVNLYLAVERGRPVSAGLVAPADGPALVQAACWGQPAVAEGLAQGNPVPVVPGTSYSQVLAAAAANGHLGLVQRLRAAGCPWDCTAVGTCLCVWKETVEATRPTLFWLLDNGAPIDFYWLTLAADSERLDVLEWARANGKLSTTALQRLRSDLCCTRAHYRPPLQTSYIADRNGPFPRCVMEWLAGVTAERAYCASRVAAEYLTGAAAHATKVTLPDPANAAAYAAAAAACNAAVADVVAAQQAVQRAATEAKLAASWQAALLLPMGS